MLFYNPQMENTSFDLKVQQVTDCSEYMDMSPNWIILFTISVNVILCLIATVGNMLILVALQSDSQLYPPSKLLFRFLASTDLCVGLISQPCFGIFLFSVARNRLKMCEITKGLVHVSSAVFCGISLFTLTAMSVDRLLALQLGLRYRQVVTVARVRGIIVLTWLVLTSLCMLYYWNRNIFLTFLLINALLSLVASTVCYLKIIFTLRRRRAQICQQTHMNNFIPGRLLRYQKTVSSLMWVSLAIISFYLPFMIVTVVRLTHRNTPSVVRAEGFAACLIYLNYSLNPFIYCWKIIEVRRAVKRTLRRCWPFCL